jgi:hypothetical protein
MAMSMPAAVTAFISPAAIDAALATVIHSLIAFSCSVASAVAFVHRFSSSRAIRRE